MFNSNAPCKFCGDPLQTEDVIKGNEFCSEECALAELTGDESFVYLEEEEE